MTGTRPYSIHALKLGLMDNFVYLIEDHATQQGAVVDPAWRVKKIIQLASGKGIRITEILLTHSHYDHVNGVQKVLDHYDARLHLLKPEAAFWGKTLPQPILNHGGDVICLGKTEIHVLHTPGHTPGSACYRINDDLITGDTLFVFGCGRCDLKGGDPEAMFHTLKRLTQALPAHTVIHPGHDYAERPTSTLSEQITGNPFLHFKDLSRFVGYRMHEHDRVRHTPYRPVIKLESTK